MRIVLLFLFFPLSFICQQIKLDSVFCDCQKARPVILRGSGRVGPTFAPSGPGSLNEISEKKQRTPFAFEKEHNSAWYKLTAAEDGNLTFDIIPVKFDDDYDFLIFKARSKNFRDSFLQLRSKPIRSCISKNKKELKGLTGLKIRSKKEFINEGPGDAYVKALEVKKGETFYLVLDNVHEKGAGHSINFSYEEIITVSGQVTNEKLQPIKTDITITNSKGDTVEKTITDEEGYYKIEALLKKNYKYSLNFFNDETFFNSKELTTKTPTDSLQNIRTVLPELKKGGKYNIKTINFYGGSPLYLPAALPSINSLYKIMKKNAGLKILIVGHTNGCSGIGAIDSQKLSVERAKAIQSSLIKRSIAADRISIAGRGCSEMLYPEGGAEWQQSLNRRVEIKVLEK